MNTDITQIVKFETLKLNYLPEQFGLGSRNLFTIYRVSHIEMVETKWLWGVVELRIFMNYGA